jgi:hypothetical protein
MNVEEIIEQVKILRLQPKDVLVVKCEGGVDEFVLHRLRQEFTKIMGFPVAVIGMDVGEDVGIIRGGPDVDDYRPG